MKVSIEPGLYVVAVSGGVDSMVLLDMLSSDLGLRLVVAHYDHGIRPDSIEDRRLVQRVSRQYGLQFVYDEGALGSDVSEDVARVARYKFLHCVRESSGARGIITAHHQDDLLETAIHNMLRGTSWRGLVSLRSGGYVSRPLLHIPKVDLVAYAKDQGLVWREDSTNDDLRFRRNYIRHKIVPNISSKQRNELLQRIYIMRERQVELDIQLMNYLHMQPSRYELSRQQFIMLPHATAREVMASWLRSHGVGDFSNTTLERLVMASKTLRARKQVDITNNRFLVINKDILAITKNDR